ncbi:MAG: hypothetical protein OXR66_07855 [Candidatus Woesearchaeota archaeon]|nr:hypothetical protein [Candidatus Woesearchaeota archaeon]
MAKRKAIRKKTARKTRKVAKARKKRVVRKTRKKARKAVKKVRKAKKSTPRKKATRKRSKKTRKVAKKARKKPVRRKAPKRDNAAKQRTTSRKRVYNLTREVPDHQYFILANGKPVKHVAELASLLDQLEEHVFDHHVTPDKNDFHSWVKDVFADVQLARKIAGVGSKKRLQLVIYKHLAGHE